MSQHSELTVRPSRIVPEETLEQFIAYLLNIKIQIITCCLLGNQIHARIEYTDPIYDSVAINQQEFNEFIQDGFNEQLEQRDKLKESYALLVQQGVAT